MICSFSMLNFFMPTWVNLFFHRTRLYMSPIGSLHLQDKLLRTYDYCNKLCTRYYIHFSIADQFCRAHDPLQNLVFVHHLFVMKLNMWTLFWTLVVFNLREIATQQISGYGPVDVAELNPLTLSWNQVNSQKFKLNHNFFECGQNSYEFVTWPQLPYIDIFCWYLVYLYGPDHLLILFKMAFTRYHWNVSIHYGLNCIPKLRFLKFFYDNFDYRSMN